MTHFFYKCSECGREYEITPDLMVCPSCSQNQKDDEPLRGILEVNFKADDTKPDLNNLMPVDPEFFPKVPVGNTPLWQPNRLIDRTDFSNLYIKDDTHNLTGSYKDRASLLVAAFAKQHNINEIVLASTGNAASSMAGIGAAAGLDITIFLPETAPKAKMIQSLQYGAKVIPVAGTYDDAFNLSLEYSQKFKVLSRNTAYNPLTIEGKKSAAIEIFQQLNKAPDFMFIPTGDGVILSGIYKGFKDLLQLGFIKKMPTIIAVQAESSNAISKALKTNTFSPINAQTVADSISVGIPRCGWYALQQLQKYQGQAVEVSDDEILFAQKELSETAGLFAEPAAAAAFAGFLKKHNDLPQNATVVLMITGNGLKDIDSAMKTIKFPVTSIKSLEEIK